jgi:hypothetical protein
LDLREICRVAEIGFRAGGIIDSVIESNVELARRGLRLLCAAISMPSRAAG